MIDIKAVHSAYQTTVLPIDNDTLYTMVANTVGASDKVLSKKQPVGEKGEPHNLFKRRVRWHQQTLKQLGVIENIPGKRGLWQLTEDAKKGLNMAKRGVKLVAYSTNLGVAIWGDNRDVLNHLDEPLHLCITSPPYPLRSARNYGNVDERAWVDFIVESLLPVVTNLASGGSVVLNVSNDIFMSKSPARSMYLERMVIALHDELGLQLMDRWQWVNLSKPPAPTYWACRERQQLCTGYEPVYWFTNDPLKVRSDNRRVLEPHSDKQKALMAAGGDKRTIQYGDGAYKLRPGSFGRETAGKIPKNVIMRGHSCPDTRALRDHAKRLGLPPHSAMFPTTLAEFAVQFLTEPGDLVLDHFSGSNKVGLTAERNGRRWLAVEKVLQYIRTQAEMFKGFDGFELQPSMRLIA